MRRRCIIESRNTQLSPGASTTGDAEVERLDLYHGRFFLDVHQMIATSVLYLAGKVEEEHVRLTDVINVTYRILHRDKAPLDIGSLYLNLRESVVRCELFIARVLGFQFAVDHPHKYLVHYLKSVSNWLDRRIVNQFPIAATSWAFLSDSYHGTACITHRPDVIAVAALYMALQCYGVTVPPHDSESTKYQWWEALVHDVRWSDVKIVINEMFDLYDFETTVSQNVRTL